MRNLFFSLMCMVVCSAASGQAASIQWMSLEEAVEAQKKEPRKIMMDVYTQWCGPCKMMMANTFTNANVINYVNANYYAVKFDAESPGDIQFQGEDLQQPHLRPQPPWPKRGARVVSCPRGERLPNAGVLRRESRRDCAHQRLQASWPNGAVPQVLHEAYQPEDGQEAWEQYRDSFEYTWR